MIGETKTKSCYWPKIDLWLPGEEMKRNRYFENRQQAEEALTSWRSTPAFVEGNKTLWRELGRDPLIGLSFVIWKSQEFMQAPDMID